LVENVKWGEGLDENSEYRHMGGGGLKLLKKRHMIFKRSLSRLIQTLWHGRPWFFKGFQCLSSFGSGQLLSTKNTLNCETMVTK